MTRESIRLQCARARYGNVDIECIVYKMVAVLRRVGERWLSYQILFVQKIVGYIYLLFSLDKKINSTRCAPFLDSLVTP